MADENMRDLLIEEEMKDAYLTYAMSVIVSRALPDVRDGLKPSQRRVIATLNDLNLNPQRKTRKCAKIVGDCTGNYHPHGTSAVYDTLVRLAQDFNMRYPLVEGQGNFGSIDDDPPAAERYTEAKMTWASVDLLADLDLDTVDFVPNYDDTTTEPTVLPGKFPNLICNGSTGIAVGMATSIPPHNLNEISDALLALMAEPDISDVDLLKLVPGPDFPTGGVIMGRRGIQEAYVSGRGRVVMRGEIDVIPDEKRDKAQLVIKSLPYQVSLRKVREKLVEVVQQGRLEGVSDIRHEGSGDDFIRLVVELKRGVDAEIVKNRIFQLTPLQSTFSINMLAIQDGRPKTFTLRDMLTAFRDHRIDVIRKRTRFLLTKALERLHIIEGLQIAADNIDAVIALIRSSEDVETARTGLRERFELTERQADAILRMPLSRLTNLEQQKLADERAGLETDAAGYREILASEAKVLSVIADELKELRERYGDARRTRIEETEAGDFLAADLIAEETVVITLSHGGYIKACSLQQYRAQRRGGKGVTGAETKEGDFIQKLFTASTHDYLLCFTDHGRMHWKKVYTVPQFGRTARGRSLANLIELQEGERVTAVIPVEGDFDEQRQLVMATASGTVKKTALSAFKHPQRRGIIAISLDDGDKLIGVELTDGSQDLILGTKNGMAIRFNETEVRSMGRTARGVRGIRLEDEDHACGLVVVSEGHHLLTVCAGGYGKRSEFDEYRLTGRGGKGIIDIRTSDRNGQVIGQLAVEPEDDIMLITVQGQVIRTRVSDVSIIGRATQGVRLISIADGDHVVAVARVDREPDDDEMGDDIDGEVVDGDDDGDDAASPDEDRDGASAESDDGGES